MLRHCATLQGNYLLASLHPAEYDRLSPHLELTSMGHGDVLYESGGRLTNLFFPTTSILSIQHELENGCVSEIASVGNEGMLGVSLFMGGHTTPSRAIVHSSGYAYRLHAKLLLDEFHRKGHFFDLLLRYTQSLMTQMAQTSVCNSHHSTMQRLSRWLLQTLDRSATSELVVTQEVLGSLLGVRREGVTEAAGRLQSLGLISCRRGHIRVLTRIGLEQQVCECYAVVKRETARLMINHVESDYAIRVQRPERDAMHTRRTGNADRRGRNLVGEDVEAAEQTQSENPLVPTHD